MKKRLVISNNISALPQVAALVENVCRNAGVSEVLTMKLNLVLEEAVTNIILYAYPKKQPDEINIEIESTKDQLTFTLSDKGIPFDPTQAEEADITLAAEERPIGGLGIYIIRKIMTEVTYERTDNTNVFIMKKRLDEKK